MFYIHAGKIVATAETFSAAVKFVNANILRPANENFTLHWELQTTGGGQIGISSWNAPTRRMSADEIETQASKDCKVAWRLSPPLVTDKVMLAKYFRFTGEAVDCVQIIEENWQRDYMVRSDHSGNQKAAEARAMVSLGETSPVIAAMAAREF